MQFLQNFFKGTVVLVLVMAGAFNAATAGNDEPTLDETYDELQKFLNAFVFETGPPLRGRPLARHLVNTRIVNNVNAKTRYEANRVAYVDIEPQHAAWLAGIRETLESYGHPLDRETQATADTLAFWLNLRTAALLEQMIALSPTDKLSVDQRDALLAERRFLAGDQMVSIGDIDQFILTTWDAPIVLYGFHDGTIGSPSIQPRAHRAETVMTNLSMNAYEFNNSIRGVDFRRNTTRVAPFFARYGAHFGWDEDPQALIAHMSTYAGDSLTDRMRKNERVTYQREMLYTARLLLGEMYSNASFIAAMKPSLGFPGVDIPWAARAFDLYHHTLLKFRRPGFLDRHREYMAWMEKRPGSVVIEEVKRTRVKGDFSSETTGDPTEDPQLLF